jgi:hypothetical protein
VKLRVKLRPNRTFPLGRVCDLTHQPVLESIMICTAIGTDQTSAAIAGWLMDLLIEG